jgi:hypothetical protein
VNYWKAGVVYRNKNSGHLLLCVHADIFVWLTCGREFGGGVEKEWHVWQTPNGRLPTVEKDSVREWRKDFVEVLDMHSFGVQLINSVGNGVEGNGE